MDDKLKVLGDLLSKGGAIGFSLGMGTGFILLVDSVWPTLMKLNDELRSYTWASFFLGWGFAISGFIVHKYNQFEKKQANDTEAQARNEYLKHLTPAEKLILKPYIDGPTRTWDQIDFGGVLNGLVEAGILRKAGALRDHPTNPKQSVCAYNMTDWAWKYLRQNAHLLNA